MEAELKFEREGVDGIAVVGSYLIDAERRLGIGVHSDCGRLGLCDSCSVNIREGGDCLSAPTKAENEILGIERLQKGDRLSCQVKIENAGDIVVATLERKDPRTEKERIESEFKRDFETLPLGEKISKLLELEAVTLTETLSFVVNSPYKIGQTVVDTLSRFGIRKDRDMEESPIGDESGVEDAHDAETNDDGAETAEASVEDPAK